MFLEKFGGEMNADYLQKQFAGLGLTAFTEHMEKLARIWLQGEPGEAFYQQLFDYMQGCGIYGKDENGIWKLPECAPGKVIKVLLSLENAENQSPVTLEFLNGNDCQIDEMKVFSRDYVEAPLFELSADETENIKALKIHKENQEVFITGNDFKFSFNVKTGLLTGGWARQNNKILVGGPILNVHYLKLCSW